MSREIKTAGTKLNAFLNVIFLQDFDMQKAYVTAGDLASQKGITFNGVILWGLPTNPPTFAESLSFTLSSSQVNDVFEALLLELKIDKSVVRIGVTPLVQAPEKQPPKEIFG